MLRRAAFVALALALLCALLPPRGAHANNVWPQPQQMSKGNGAALSIDPKSFSVKSNSSSAVLAAAIDRYQSALFFPFAAKAQPQRKGLGAAITLLSVLSGEPGDALPFQLGVDESYEISIGADGTSTITAPNDYGAMRGLETFAQLIDYDYSSGAYSVASPPIAIKDWPRFPWRGLLIDTARHYLHKSTIKRAIDVLSYAKFNVLHWHTVDAQSFPIESQSYPLLTKGAYAPTATYTASDVKDIIAYGQARGVRVMPEFDVPGHSASWGVGYPSIVAHCPAYQANINNIPLNPANPQTFQVLSGLLQEMSELFVDDYLHLGGDEVVTGCWFNDPSIAKWMQQHNIATGIQMMQYFETKLQQIVANVSADKTMVLWEEQFDDGIDMPADVVINVWKDQATLKRVVDAGRKAVLSAGFYLDKQIPNPGSTFYEWVDTWKNFYANDPTADFTSAEAKRVLGGEAAMWGEQVDDTNFDSRVFPRSFATAERLWSDASVNDVNAALPRLVEFRCRVARRGIGAGPVAPDYCPLPQFS